MCTLRYLKNICSDDWYSTVSWLVHHCEGSCALLTRFLLAYFDTKEDCDGERVCLCCVMIVVMFCFRTQYHSLFQVSLFSFVSALPLPMGKCILF